MKLPDLTDVAAPVRRGRVDEAVAQNWKGEDGVADEGE